VISCGGKVFSGKNATYTSKDAFVETIGQWIEENLLKRLHQAEYFSLLADECTDISTIEELSVGWKMHFLWSTSLNWFH